MSFSVHQEIRAMAENSWILRVAGEQRSELLLGKSW